MAKLGYTWYPKDWGNSEAVFELTLIERGLYRELIDMAMLNDNQTVINNNVWARKFGSSIEEIKTILDSLERLGLIQIDFDGSETLFIQSCEKRLVLVRAGSKGGKKSKPIVKPMGKPLPKPIVKQREKKEKGKETKDKQDSFEVRKESFIDWFNNSKKTYTGKIGKSKTMTTTDENNLKRLFESYTFTDFNEAIPNLYKSQWAKENNMLTISHFIRVENFNKYLEQGDAISKHQAINSQPAN